MSYLEKSGFCPRSEYERYERNIVAVDDLVIDELYLLMVSLKEGGIGREAIKHPICLDSVEPYKSSIYKVEFILCDEDLTDVDRVYGLFKEDGYLHNSFGKPSLFNSGYFRDYQDGLDGEWMDFSDSMSIGALKVNE